MIVFRRKNFAFFGKTIANFNNMTSAFKAGNYGQAAKSGLGVLGRGSLGVAKGVGGAALAAGAIGGYKAISTTKDALTGELGNSD